MYLSHLFFYVTAPFSAVATTNYYCYYYCYCYFYYYPCCCCSYSVIASPKNGKIASPKNLRRRRTVLEPVADFFICKFES